MRHFLKPVCAAALVALASAAHADIKIGAIAPLSGGSAPMGESVQIGMRIAVQEINAKGGVLGQKLILVERDDEAKNDNGEKLAVELIEKEKVAAFISFCNTGVALTAIDKIQNARLPLVIPCAGGAPMTRKFAAAPEGNYIFRVSADDVLQARKVASEALRRGFTKVAVLTDDTAYGKFGHDELVKAAKDLGVEIVSDEKFKLGVKDLSAPLAKGKDAGAEAVLTWGIGPELAVMAKSRVDIKFDVPMIGGWTLSMSNFVTGAGVFGNGVVMPATYLQFSPKNAKQAAFTEKALKAAGKDVLSSSPAAAQSYDSVYLLAAAMEQAQSTNGTKVKDALENLTKPVVGVVKTYKRPYSKSNHEAQDDRSLGMGEIKDGKVYMVE
jgi:branched-chain amino acid transport system substrate-binding protein